MKYRLKILTKNIDLTKAALDIVINRLNTNFIRISKYGPYEPCKKVFSSENLDDIYNQIKSRILLKGKGKGKGITTDGSISFDYATGICWWSFSFEFEKEIDNDRLGEIVQLVQSINNEMAIIYGFMSSEVEYNRLHEEIEYYEGGGSSRGMPGVSIREFSEYLPGVYWMNIFGKELSQALGTDKVKSIPNVEFVDIGKDAVVFHLDEPIDPLDVNGRTGKLYKINQFLGVAYFFNLVNSEERKFSHSVIFKKYLEEIRNDFSKSRTKR